MQIHTLLPAREKNPIGLTTTPHTHEFKHNHVNSLVHSAFCSCQSFLKPDRVVALRHVYAFFDNSPFKIESNRLPPVYGQALVKRFFFLLIFAYVIFWCLDVQSFGLITQNSYRSSTICHMSEITRCPPIWCEICWPLPCISYSTTNNQQLPSRRHFAGLLHVGDLVSLSDLQRRKLFYKMWKLRLKVQCNVWELLEQCSPQWHSFFSFKSTYRVTVFFLCACGENI